MKAVMSFFDELDFAYQQGNAEAFLTERLALLATDGLADSPESVLALNELGCYFRGRGRYEEAEEALHEAAAILSARNEADTLDFATTLNNLATTKRMMGNNADAMVLYEEAMQIYGGADDPPAHLMAGLMNNVAMLQMAEGDFKAANASLRQAIDWLRKDGSKRDELATALSNLASNMIMTGELGSAVEALDESIALFTSLNDESSHFAAALNSMAAIEASKCNDGEAAALLERAMRIVRASFGENDDFKRMAAGLATLRMKPELVEAIIEAEWTMFTEVNSTGGRSSCQDDRGTFELMRKSQFLAWSATMLASYFDDLQTAANEGRNIVAEKYGHMMQFHAPEEYAAIAPLLKAVTPEQKRMAELITSRHLQWFSELSDRYPRIAKKSRPASVGSSTDGGMDANPGSENGGAASVMAQMVPMENYSTGELYTMSEETLTSYCSHIDTLSKLNCNMAEIILENTARLYGYESLADAEQGIEA
jgi:tetratricopeptide (TPR) repeat protein